ncbi:hypothetical protein NXX87_00730 [Bacteroides faecis]|nr:hypothetical protein [Bacteroides faecis]UVS34737.1 hypothetical protein NXX87_00730 [Bacteroides faecis]
MVKLNIKGSSFAAQYRRTTGRAIDSTDNWESKEEADRYAQNLEEEAYFPYDGQIITVKESGKTNLYTLVVDESITIQDGKKHFKLEPVASQSYADDRYLQKGIKDTLEKGVTSKGDIDIESGGLNVEKLTRLKGGVVVMADTDYGVTESEKENPENNNVMAIGLTEVPKNSGFGSTSLGEMDNTDESFDLVPDGNYIMQKACRRVLSRESCCRRWRNKAHSCFCHSVKHDRRSRQGGTDQVHILIYLVRRRDGRRHCHLHPKQ